MSQFNLDYPNTQISFAKSLGEIRKTYLQDALLATVASLPISKIDSELHHYVKGSALSLLATHGIRGELLFAVPCILAKNPKLLGYYRLLLGYSQKGFYASASGIGMFKSLEGKGTLTKKQDACLADLCRELIEKAIYFLENIEAASIKTTIFDQLTLLTLGPQLRGGANVQKGTEAIIQVFNVILDIVSPAVVESNRRHIRLKNKAGREVNIQFSSDPDIVIREVLALDTFKNSVAIEVKGGQDYSNIHNRIGEAEKSHQKAKNDGYVECWTVVNVDNVNMSMAKHESPTTNKFYRLSCLLESSSDEYRDFALQIKSIVGI